MTPVARWLLYVVAAYLGLLGLTYGMGVASTWHQPPAVALDGFPARVDAPWPWTPTLDSAPVTAVPVAIGGSTPGLHNILTDTEGSVSFVDARGGQHILDVASEGAATPGESLLLSPDGTMVAYPHDALGSSPDSSIAVRTLGDGHIRRLPVPAPAGGHATPLAWSPHQDRLAVYIEGSSIGVLTLDTGTYRTVLPFPAGLAATPRTPIAAAFSSNGDLAVQLDTTVCAKQGCFSLPAGQRLAGKGAYTPADNSLAVVTDAGRDSTITFISETNGSPLPGTIHLYGVTTLRLIGWWADRALVVAFRPEPVTDLGPLDDERDYPPTAYALVQRLSILAIAPSLTTPPPPSPQSQPSPQPSSPAQVTSPPPPPAQASPSPQVSPLAASQFSAQVAASASPQVLPPAAPQLSAQASVSSQVLPPAAPQLSAQSSVSSQVLPPAAPQLSAQASVSSQVSPPAAPQLSAQSSASPQVLPPAAPQLSAQSSVSSQVLPPAAPQLSAQSSASPQTPPQAQVAPPSSSQSQAPSHPAAQVPASASSQVSPPTPSEFSVQASTSASPQSSARAAVPTQAQELMVLPDQILSIDIADRALLAGHTSPGRPAPAWPARPGVLTALVGLPAAPVAFIVFLVGAIRRELAAASTTR
ncbi:hypothetical protein [Dactylosporangium sp. NPDC006015]|uniref:hypothetical protein n=1 Tax=Dactylosporangium sp. NPDC006015 TaxID=3154576 RepID=UPI0033AC1733